MIDCSSVKYVQSSLTAHDVPHTYKNIWYMDQLTPPRTYTSLLITIKVVWVPLSTTITNSYSTMYTTLDMATLLQSCYTTVYYDN